MTDAPDLHEHTPCCSRVEWLEAALTGVSATEPGAPDPLEAVQIAVEGLGGYPVPPEGIDWAWVHRGDLLNALASQPVPAPEPSARLREDILLFVPEYADDEHGIRPDAARRIRAALATTPQDPNGPSTSAPDEPDFPDHR